MPTTQHINQRQVEAEAAKVREIFTEEMAFTAGFAGYMGVCQAAIIGSHSVQLPGALRPGLCPQEAFLRRQGTYTPGQGSGGSGLGKGGAAPSAQRAQGGVNERGLEWP